MSITDGYYCVHLSDSQLGLMQVVIAQCVVKTKES